MDCARPLFSDILCLLNRIQKKTFQGFLKVVIRLDENMFWLQGLYPFPCRHIETAEDRIATLSSHTGFFFVTFLYFLFLSILNYNVQQREEAISLHIQVFFA